MEETWTFDGEAARSADEVYHQQLSPIDVTAFSAGFPVQQGQVPLLPHREHREIYADSLFELSRLLEEVRFEVALAVMLLVDFRVHRDLGEVKVQAAPSRDTGMPMQILAWLASYAAPPPSPTALLRSLHQPMSGCRYLSRWLAAQLLDSAILRALSCMDRVVTMLHLRAGRAVKKRKDGTLRLPAFTRQDLRVLRPVYEQHSAWGEFRAILDHPVYELIKRFRDGMVHHRRWPSELHGESQVSYWDAGGLAVDGGGPEQIYEGLRAQDHVALLVATWNEVIGPTVELGGRLLSKAAGRAALTVDSRTACQPAWFWAPRLASRATRVPDPADFQGFQRSISDNTTAALTCPSSRQQRQRTGESAHGMQEVSGLAPRRNPLISPEQTQASNKRGKPITAIARFPSCQ